MIEELKSLIKAGFSGIWIKTYEPQLAQSQIATMASENDFEVASWKISGGYTWIHSSENGIQDSETPMYPLTRFNEGRKKSGRLLVLLHNFHRFLNSDGAAKIVQAFHNAILAGRTEECETCFIVLSPLVQIPIELEKLLTVVDHKLPTQEEFKKVLEDINVDGEPITYEDGVLEASSGLTSLEAENAYSLSVFATGKVRVQEVLNQKIQCVKKKGFLELYHGTESFSSLGGLDGLKTFCKRLLRPHNPVVPRGILLVGIPGCGKSASIKALGKEVGRPVLMMDVGRLQSKYVGESEANVSAALDLADSMAPCILFID